ncbi:MAG: PAS domain-containing sensor histidine kinase [Clostridia bacterium]|jgi:nitrogen-specific signal transduction histidine kinase
MRWFKRFERQVFPIAAAILVVGLILAVWGMGMRESSNRRLYLELEAYRTLTAMTDLVRAGGLDREDILRVNSFGLYSAEGQALYRYGEAPLQLDAISTDTLPSQIELGKDSIILYRLLGNDFPGRRPGGLVPMGQMGPMGQLGPMGQMNQTGRPRRDMSMSPTAEPMPAMAYIDYSLGDYTARQASLLTTLLAVSIALAGLYAALILMYRRYLAAADSEARNRELVELGEAARTIVHEIKNPLGVIRIQCGLLRRGADKAAASGIAVIEDEVLRLTMMADRIRTYLSPADRQSQPVLMEALIAGFSDRYAEAVRFETRLAGDEMVSADENRLVEALDNIIANARDAMAGSDSVPDVEIFSRQQRVLIQVSDRGTGIAPEIRKKLFEPFFTTKPRGTGLGLALARKNIEACGGSLVYTERQGGGSVFTVSLPFFRRKPVAQ